MLVVLYAVIWIVLSYKKKQKIKTLNLKNFCNKSSAVAEIGDRGHNKHGSKRGGCCGPFAVSSNKIQLTA